MRETLQDVIAASLPPAFVAQLYPKIAFAYQESAAQVNGMTLLEDAERRNLLPYLRRNVVEAQVRKVALDCGLHATVEWTETRSAQFTMIRGPRTRLTLSKTAHYWAMPDTCYFRKQNSSVNEMIMQGKLFAVAEPTTTDDELLYGIITHGPEHGGVALGFVNIGFPSPDMQSWAEPTVSILAIQERQQRLYQKATDTQAEQQELKRAGKLKENIRKQNDEDGGQSTA